MDRIGTPDLDGERKLPVDLGLNLGAKDKTVRGRVWDIGAHKP